MTRLRSKKAIVTAVVVALALTLSLGACDGGGGRSSNGGSNGGGNAGEPVPLSSGGAAPESVDEIILGYVTSFTGPLSGFTVATKWVDEMCLGVINNEWGGIEVDGSKKKIRVIYEDTESNVEAAKDIAKATVLEKKVDILVGAWTIGNTVPVSEIGEQYGVPTYILNSPAESWIAGGGPYYWAMGTLYYTEDLLTNAIGAFKKLDSNQKVGFVFDGEADNVEISTMLKPMLEEEGFTVYDPGRFAADTEDYADIIRKLQAENCDLIIANMTGSQFTAAWKQFNDNDYIPKAFNIGKAVRFQSDVEALGPGLGNGLISEAFWDRSFPFTSPLIGLSCEELAQKWEDGQGSQFPATLGYDVSLWEVLSDALKRAGTTEPEALRRAILETDVDSIYGHLKFDENQVAKAPCVAAQWHKGEKWPYEKTIVSAVTMPSIPSEQPFIMPNATQE